MSLQPSRLQVEDSPFNESQSKRKGTSIGSLRERLQQPKSSKKQNSKSSKNSSLQKSPNKSYTFKKEPSVKGKTFPTSFVIGNMIRSINEEPLNPYWGQQSSNQLFDILGDEPKLNRYIQSLEAESVSSGEDVAYIYQILTVLLRKVKENNPVIHKSADNFVIEFNRNMSLDNEIKIDELKRELAAKEKEMNDIEEKYKKVIGNYLDSLEQLSKHQQFQRNQHSDHD